MQWAPIPRILTVSLHRWVFDQEVADCAGLGGYRTVGIIYHAHMGHYTYWPIFQLGEGHEY
jgi:hypothetical protein